MRVAGVSDQHGFLSHSTPEADVLAIVGDIMPLLSSAENWKQWQELRWVEAKYVKWLKRQPATWKLISWGNHDIAAMAPDTRRILTDLLNDVDGVLVLDNDDPSVVIEGVRFSGYPYTPTIQQRNWAFSLPRGDARVDMALEWHVHPETDILLSHGPPMGFLDRVPRDSGKVENVGCAMLAKKIIEVAPAAVMCGHIHEERGNRASMWNCTTKPTRLINVSLCDRNYTVRGARVQTYDYTKETT